ncbi:hypothetical protein [uncultured Lacinutrix sp.]|uniref:hypothetical protein n=1 Tax=uncultured Lacinutrix sp. TaxID=574032 RepID=UPI00262974A7|nr:hypothetical protein [uncultured Lacinutrix sp.]
MITDQLRRFKSGYAHHVVGQFANIDFWLNEVLEAQKTIDQYNSRFNNIRDIQKNWINSHGTKVYDYCPHCGGKCELSNGTPSPPNRISSSDMNETRRNLVNSAYYFLTRCYRMGLLNDDELKQKCDLIGTSIDPNDLKK